MSNIKYNMQLSYAELKLIQQVLDYNREMISSTIYEEEEKEYYKDEEKRNDKLLLRMNKKLKKIEN